VITAQVLFRATPVAQRIAGYGFVNGVGYTSSDDPKENLLSTPWWTDGQRAVLMLSDTPVPTEEMQFLDWTQRISGSE
jgi:hypothetical protein